jgi:dTDP-4-amino-4,6-dideoxygalactose transaminase
VPPAGTPLEITQILRALKMAYSSPGNTKDCLASFAEQLQVAHVFATSSGRVALWLILRSLHRLRPNRCVVAVPAYTCFSVPASIVRAGLKLCPVEIDPETLDFDFSQLEVLREEKLLCILTTNLFGLMNNVSRIQQIARSKGAFLVDDAAQALGSSQNGHFSGTLGDVGLYSLGRGKALAAVEGGLVVTNSHEIALAIQTELETLPAPSLTHAAWLFLRMLANSVFLNPRLYWIPNSLPFLKLGITEFDPSFSANRLSRLSCALLPRLLDKLQQVNQIRRRNAHVITQALEGCSLFTVPRPLVDCQPTYTRFPLIAKDEVTKRRVLARLQEGGIGASPFYPTAICDIPEIGSYMVPGDFHRPRAEALSRRLLTLPTHPFVQQQDLDRMTQILTRS